MRWTKAAVLALGMSMLFGAVALAGTGFMATDDFTGPYFGGDVAWVIPTGETNGNGVTIAADSGFGVGLWGGYRFNKLVQFDAEVIWSDHDVDFRDRVNSVNGVDSTGVVQLLTEVNFHFLYYCGVQVYAGPVIGYAFFNSLDYGSNTFDVEDDWIFGGNIGVDVPFSGRDDEKGWNFTARVKYLYISPSATNTSNCDYCGGIGDGGDDDGSGGGSSDVTNFELKMDPWVIQAGVLYKW